MATDGVLSRVPSEVREKIRELEEELKDGGCIMHAVSRTVIEMSTMHNVIGAALDLAFRSIETCML